MQLTPKVWRLQFLMALHSDPESNSDGGGTPATPSFKRGHDMLLDALTLTGRKKAKTRSVINDYTLPKFVDRPTRDAPLEPYLKAARWIPRSINPFTNINMVFALGLQDGYVDDGEGFDL